ncbi:hypothetical protein AB0O76_12490 [Streptomyces sp. NPDC086554]
MTAPSVLPQTVRRRHAMDTPVAARGAEPGGVRAWVFGGRV